MCCSDWLVPLPSQFSICNISPWRQPSVLQAAGFKKVKSSGEREVMATNTLFQVIWLKAEALAWPRVFQKSVQTEKSGPRTKEFGLDPTRSEEPRKYLKQDHEATGRPLRTEKGAEDV